MKEKILYGVVGFLTVAVLVLAYKVFDAPPKQVLTVEVTAAGADGQTIKQSIPVDQALIILQRDYLERFDKLGTALEAKFAEVDGKFNPPSE